MKINVPVHGSTKINAKAKNSENIFSISLISIDFTLKANSLRTAKKKERGRERQKGAERDGKRAEQPQQQLYH